MHQYFKDQLEVNKPITPEVYPRIEYKRVWSGEEIRIGDTVLFAYAYRKGSRPEDARLMTVLDRELDQLGTTFEFDKFNDAGVPILKFR